MALVTGNMKLAKEICDALGIKNCKRLDLHMAYDEIFTATVEFYPEIDGIEQMVPILKKFKLVAIEDEDSDKEEVVCWDIDKCII